MPVKHIIVVSELAKIWVERHHRVRRTEVEHVVDAPVHLAHLACWVEQALQRVVEQHARTERDPHGLDGVHNSADYVRRCFEAVRPDEVHQVQHAVFAAHASDT